MLVGWLDDFFFLQDGVVLSASKVNETTKNSPIQLTSSQKDSLLLLIHAAFSSGACIPLSHVHVVGFVGSSALDVRNKSRVVVEMVMDRVVFTHHNVRAMRLH